MGSVLVCSSRTLREPGAYRHPTPSYTDEHQMSQPEIRNISSPAGTLKASLGPTLITFSSRAPK